MNNSTELYLNKWWVLVGFGLSVTILNLDLTIVNLALPVIARIFHISLTSLQWINNSFILASACVTMLAGHFADQFGRRKIYLWGMAVFALGSLIASVAMNSWMIVAGRSLRAWGLASLCIDVNPDRRIVSGISARHRNGAALNFYRRQSGGGANARRRYRAMAGMAVGVYYQFTDMSRSDADYLEQMPGRPARFRPKKSSAYSQRYFTHRGIISRFNGAESTQPVGTAFRIISGNFWWGNYSFGNYVNHATASLIPGSIYLSLKIRYSPPLILFARFFNLSFLVSILFCHFICRIFLATLPHSPGC